MRNLLLFLNICLAIGGVLALMVAGSLYQKQHSFAGQAGEGQRGIVVEKRIVHRSVDGSLPPEYRVIVELNANRYAFSVEPTQYRRLNIGKPTRTWNDGGEIVAEASIPIRFNPVHLLWVAGGCFLAGLGVMSRARTEAVACNG